MKRGAESDNGSGTDRQAARSAKPVISERLMAAYVSTLQELGATPEVVSAAKAGVRRARKR